MGKCKLYEFSLVPGAFDYDYDDMTDVNIQRKLDKKDYMPPTLKRLPRLGLRADFDKSTSFAQENNSEPWARIRDYVDFLNRNKGGAKHKVILVVRHGYSLHNYIEKGVTKRKKVVDGVEKSIDNWRDGVNIAYKEQVGLETLTKAFKEADHELSTDLTDHLGIKMDASASTATIPLLDSKLLPKELALKLRGSGGKNNDAGDLGDELLRWVQEQSFPLPDVVYTSPLSRCLETTEKVYQKVFTSQEGKDRKFQPRVKDTLREKLNGDACNYYGKMNDSLNARSCNFAFEYGLVPVDSYKGDIKGAEKGGFVESNWALAERMKGVLIDIFNDDEEASVVSLTTHSYSIGALTKVIKCEYRLDEGDIAAFLVKATPPKGLYEGLVKIVPAKGLHD